MLPDFEKGLTGVKAGDEKTIKVKFPKDYPAEDLAGQKVEFATTVQRVEKEVLPDVDDELAAMFEVKEGGIEQFKQDVRANMEREAEEKVKSDVREQIMTELLDKNPLEVPQTLKHQEAHSMQHDAMQRMGIEDHDQAPPISNFEEMAEQRVRLSLLVSQLISDQKLTVDDAKVREHVEKMCASYDNSEDMVNLYLGNAQLVQQIQPVVLEQQAFDWLLENGKSSTKKVGFTEYMNP
jgi:trigger factor